MLTRAVSFPDWQNALAAAALAPPLQAAYRGEILAFLRHCKACHAPATTELAKQYLAERERVSDGPARAALRWFYREGLTRAAEPLAAVDRPGTARTAEPVPARLRRAEPPAAQTDLGGADWERDLIKAVRERGLLWRTEQTYREWAVRFARFMAPRSPYAAGGAEVAQFLSALAVQGRASPSAQKQALNALVFVTKRPAARAPRVVTLRSAAGQPLTQTAG